jgi:hypothetical protein
VVVDCRELVVTGGLVDVVVVVAMLGGVVCVVVEVVVVSVVVGTGVVGCEVVDCVVVVLEVVVDVVEVDLVVVLGVDVVLLLSTVSGTAVEVVVVLLFVVVESMGVVVVVSPIALVVVVVTGGHCLQEYWQFLAIQMGLVSHSPAAAHLSQSVSGSILRQFAERSHLEQVRKQFVYIHLQLREHSP